MSQRAKFSLKAEILHLPQQSTPFIGRDEEVAEISRLLADPACRLLTLVGPGGVGKTRLAVQVAERSATFAQGSYFIPLQAVESIDFLVSAVADALNLSLSGQEDSRVQLLNYIRDKEMLLLLDNFEQLLGKGGARLLADILETAPGIKLLVTSREVLNLQEEWLYPVQGLSFPISSLTPLLTGQGEELAAYSAVQLFVERVRRVRRDFSLAEEQANVVRICQLVEGMPLALELAASWTKTLACAVIADQIQRNLDFLATNLRNVPERQRSMRAVFEQSWKLLPAEEQEVFKGLAVFRGGFSQEGAARVAKASLPILANLVDKSLLQVEGNGRYQIHELLRQYAAEQLVRSPENVTRVYDLHCSYYCEYLNQWHTDMKSGRQQEAARVIATDLENVRAAWQWAIQQTKVEEISQAADTLQYFFQFRSRYQEGAAAFEQAAQSLENAAPDEQTSLTLAEVLVLQGWFCLRLGQLRQARAAFERSRAIYQELGQAPRPGTTTDPLTGLGTLANISGDYAEAEKLGEEARRLHEAQADKTNLMDAYYVLNSAAFAQGHYEAAQQHAERAGALAREVNDRWMLAYILSDMGNIARALGDYTQARQHYQASYAIREGFNDPEGMAVALNHLGKMAWLQEDYQAAEKLYQQSLAIYHDISDQGGLATSLNGLGNTACGLGDYQTAQQHFQQALQITAEIQFVPLTLTILSGIGELWWHIGQPERSVELLALVLHHPASGRETQARAQQCLIHYEAELSADEFVSAIRRGTSSDLETVVTTVQVELATPIEAEALPAPQRGESKVKDSSPPGSPALVEPLTPREFEVLRLMADGLTNQQIAEALIISVGTVKWYTGQIYSKLNVGNRTQAVARARELNLLS
jgi:predicted ATPase/DNA-binding CsgD family transcriptional regulator